MSTSKKLNQGIIKLTKENINDGHLGDKIKSISGSEGSYQKRINKGKKKNNTR